LRPTNENMDICGGGAKAALDTVAFNGRFIRAFGHGKADTLDVIIIGHGLDNKAMTDPFFALALDFKEIAALFDLNQCGLLVF